MKTEKYFIEFDYCEIGMCAPMSISKKEFNRQLAFMREQVTETKDNEETPVQEFDPIRSDLGTTERTVYVFHSGCTRTFLTELKCKPGYRFKAGGEK